MHLSQDLLLLDILIFVKIKKEISVQLNLGMHVPKALVIYIQAILPYIDYAGFILISCNLG